MYTERNSLKEQGKGPALSPYEVQGFGTIVCEECGQLERLQRRASKMTGDLENMSSEDE